MSYILNALRKSELERQSSQSGTLENSILETKDIKRNKTPVWLIILVVINIFFLAYLMWSFSRDTTQKKKEEVEVEVEKIILPTKQKVDIEDKTELLQHTNIKPIKKPQQPSIVEQYKKQQFKVKRTENKLEKSGSGVKKTNQRKVKSNLSGSESIAIKKRNTSLPIGEITSEEDGDKSNEPPFLLELGYEFRRTVPKITINVLVYSKIKSERLIMISMTKYVPGDEIIEDMILKEIREDSIVVEYKGKVFQISR